MAHGHLLIASENQFEPKDKADKALIQMPKALTNGLQSIMLILRLRINQRTKKMTVINSTLTSSLIFKSKKSVKQIKAPRIKSQVRQMTQKRI